MKKFNKKGISLLEVVMAVAVFSIFAVGVLYMSIDTIQRESNTSFETQATLYAQEGIEAVRTMRANDFLSLQNGDFGVQVNAGVWEFVQAPQNLDGLYSRTVTISDVFRNADGDIDEVFGDILDPEVKKVSVTVSWREGRNIETTTISTYITNWRGNDFISSECDDFNAGTPADTVVEPDPAGGASDCLVELADQTLTSNLVSSANVGAHGSNVAISGNTAFIAVDNNQRGFRTYDISDPNNPVMLDEFNIGQKGRHLIFDAANNNLYIGTEKASDGLKVLNVSNPSNISLRATIDLDTLSNHAVIDGNYLYLATLNDDDDDIEFDSDEGINVPDFAIVDGAIEVGASGVDNARIDLIGAAFTGGGTAQLTVGRSTLEPFGDYDDPSTGNISNTSDTYWIGSIRKNTDIILSARSWDWSGFSGWNMRHEFDSSPATQNIQVLRNGDTLPFYVPTFTPGNIESFLVDYIDTDSQTITINENQVLYLMETGQTNMAHAGVDFDDAAFIITLNNNQEQGDGGGGPNVEIDIDEGFMVYDISDANNPVKVASVDLPDIANYIAIDGNYAFVGTTNDTNGLAVIDISDPENPTLETTLDVGEEVNAIHIIGNLAYVGTEDATSSLHVIDISNPLNPLLITNVDVGGEIEDLDGSGSYLYAALDLTQAGLSVIDISAPLAPVLIDQIDVTGKATSVDVNGGYVYVTTRTSNKGLVIMSTATPGTAITGDYESEILDTGSTDTLYNYIEWDETLTTGSSISFQIRTSNSNVDILTEDWIGPDGTNSTYFETSRTPITIPAADGVRYIQFKAYLNSDGVNTPSVTEVKINYTP